MKVFTINKHGGHLGHVTCSIYISFLSYFPKNLALICQVVSEKKVFDHNGYIHVYSPGTGADNPPGLKLFSLTVLPIRQTAYQLLESSKTKA